MLIKIFAYIAFIIAVVFAYYWFKIRNPYIGEKDRREHKRRIGDRDRRQSIRGRRTHSAFAHKEGQPERRYDSSDRREGQKSRRHKRRRADDKVGNH